VPLGWNKYTKSTKSPRPVFTCMHQNASCNETGKENSPDKDRMRNKMLDTCDPTGRDPTEGELSLIKTLILANTGERSARKDNAVRLCHILISNKAKRTITEHFFNVHSPPLSATDLHCSVTCTSVGLTVLSRCATGVGYRTLREQSGCSEPAHTRLSSRCCN